VGVTITAQLNSRLQRGFARRYSAMPGADKPGFYRLFMFFSQK
jgi:hypothetical protein